MSVFARLAIVGRRARPAAIVSLVLLFAVGCSLAAWSARAARSQEQEEAPAAAAAVADTTAAQPATAAPATGIEPGEVLAAAPAAAAPSRPAPPAVQSAQPLAFSITWERTQISTDGEARLLLSSKRHQRADGTFKLVNTFHGRDGVARTETYFGVVGLGTFRLDETRQRLVFAAPLTDEELPDVEAFLRAHPQYDRAEDVRGQSAIVWRMADEDGKGYTEEYRAPALGGLLVKRIVSSAMGQEIFEPTEIALGEPSAGLFAELSAHAPDYSHFERKVRETERRGDKETSLAMRQVLSRMRAARPDGR